MPRIKPEAQSANVVNETVGAAFSASMVNQVVKKLASRSKKDTRRRWLQAVATRVQTARPDISQALVDVLKVTPAGDDVLNGLTIGEIGVCYEALLSRMDSSLRRDSGQFFTPDDAAEFMAARAVDFPEGVWLDPSCGVGNLAWHLTARQIDPASFVRTSLVLVDRDETALLTAIALITAEYAAPNDIEAVRNLRERSAKRDFLARQNLPDHDFSILNPPYSRAQKLPGYETGSCHDLFAFFLERVAKQSRGFIAVTPASYLSAPKFQVLRNVLNRECPGGDVLVFDNVPDTLFRGYKFGSNNTSKTNFVRAAITVCPPDATGWRITPIIRWQSSTRAVMFRECLTLLAPRKIGPHGEWAKVGPGLEELWDSLVGEPETLADLVVGEETQFSIEVALTPRYFISATFRSLNRGSKAVLHFRTAEDRDKAALVLNSSLPYLWWRVLDGGVTLPMRVLLSVPIPKIAEVDATLIDRLRASEAMNVVVKLNAGRENENVKHPSALVDELNAAVIPLGVASDVSLLYTSNMFPLAAIGSSRTS